MVSRRHKGDYHSDYEVWDLSDPRCRRGEHVQRSSDRMAIGNDVGFGIMEYGVGPGYYKYQDIQHFPTF